MSIGNVIIVISGGCVNRKCHIGGCVSIENVIIVISGGQLRGVSIENVGGM